MRLILNTAANVDEALEILRNYDMHSDIGTAHHLFLADAEGKSVAVEWVSGEIKVTESDVLNNHYLCEEKAGTASGELSFVHESKLLEARNRSKGKMSSEELADAMFEVIALPDGNYFGGTQWTIVYDCSQASATWYFRRDRATSYTFFAGSDIQEFNSK